MLHRNPANQAVYRFVCRNRPLYPLARLRAQVEEELDALCSLRFTEAELAYLAGLRFMKPDFIDFLRIFQYQRKFIRVWVEGDDLRIEARGPQVHVMGFEIHVLTIVNELYYRQFDQEQAMAGGRERLRGKVQLLKDAADSNPRLTSGRHPFEFFDFGARRRFSKAWQQEVLTTLKVELPDMFKGTSNVMFAKDLGLVPIGTMAHEYLLSYQAQRVRLRDFQRAALEDWVQEYRGDLGIALTDAVGMDAFLTDFDLYFAKLFDGLRHDSGDPYTWGEKALRHYESLRIDPHTKRLVFSDALDFQRALDLHAHFCERTHLGFGIGTYLTNDMGLDRINIVMKLVECNGQPVAKLPDAAGKVMQDVDATFVAYLKKVFNIPDYDDGEDRT